MSKNEKSRLDQNGPERFGRLIFATVRKRLWLEMVNCLILKEMLCDVTVGIIKIVFERHMYLKCAEDRTVLCTPAFT